MAMLFYLAGWNLFALPIRRPTASNQDNLFINHHFFRIIHVLLLE